MALYYKPLCITSLLYGCAGRLTGRFPVRADANTTDGSVISCAGGREEPRVLLDPKTAQPVVFSSLCKKAGAPPGGSAWPRVLLQRLRLKADDVSTAPRRLGTDGSRGAPNTSSLRDYGYYLLLDPGTPIPALASGHSTTTFVGDAAGLVAAGASNMSGRNFLRGLLRYLYFHFYAGFERDYGVPSSKGYAETTAGSAVFARSWTKADVSFDCNKGRGTIIMKSDDGDTTMYEVRKVPQRRVMLWTTNNLAFTNSTERTAWLKRLESGEPIYL